MTQAAPSAKNQTRPTGASAVSAAIEVRRAELPLACPRPGETLWSMHPRVYLPIEDQSDGESLCPYCGTRYRLVD
jgi:uncharacterized Zn-finger protein